MAIFFKNSWNVPPPRWGSPADVQYAIKKNCETIYNIDPESYILLLPLFWGFPILDYSKDKNNCANHGALYKNGQLHFNGTTDYGRLDHTYTTYNKGSIEVRGNAKAVNSAFISFVTDSNGSGSYLQFVFYTGGILWLYSPPVIGGDISVETNNGFSLNVSLNIIVQSDGTNTKIFVSGKEEAVTINAGNGKWFNDVPTNAANIGALHRGTEQYSPFNGFLEDVRISNAIRTPEQASKLNDLPYGLYQKVSRPFYLLPIAPGPTTEFKNLGTEISGGSESLQDLITDIQANTEAFFDLETEISATTIQTILDLDTEIAADYNVSFEDLITDIQTVAKSLTDLNTEISANAEDVFYNLNTEIEIGASLISDLTTEIITKAQIVSDLNTDIQARGDTFYDLNTDIQIRNGAAFYDLTTEISVIRSKYWLDTEIEALSYARWSFNTEWNPNRFLNTEIAAKKPYTFSFKTKTGSGYVASSSEIEILLSGYSWPLRTLFLDFLRVGTSNMYNFDIWFARGHSGKNPLRNTKIKAEYIDTQFANGYEVITCDWLSLKVEDGAYQTVNETPLLLGDMPCDSKLSVSLKVECRDCSLTRGLVYFKLVFSGDYTESVYNSIGYGDGSQYFSGDCDDYRSPNFIARLYVVG